MASAETTYGDTRAVPKEAPSDRGGGSPDDGECDRSDDDDDGNSSSSGGEWRIKPGAKGIATCFSIELNGSGGNSLGAVFALPIWFALCPAVYQLAAGPVHVAIGNAEADDRVDRWRYGMGFHVGWDWLSRTSYGPGTGGHLEAVGPLMGLGNGSLDFRLRGEGALSAQSMQVDYERYVFSDSMKVGVEHDRMDGYSRWAFPLTAELLWHPGSLGFYLGAGGGATLMRETIDIHRRTPVPGGSGDYAATRDSWSPAASFAIGRESLGRHGKPNWYFEIRWQALLFEPRHRSSFPADNATGSHGIGWVWGWYL